MTPDEARTLQEALTARDDARANATRLAETLREVLACYQPTDGLYLDPVDVARWRAVLDSQPTPAPDPIAVLDAEVSARRQIAAELDRVAADDRLTAGWLEKHGLGPTAHVTAVFAALALDIGAGEVHGRREQFDGSVPPGGYVCAEPGEGPDGICGMPVESEPCTTHHPADGATPPTPEPGGPPRPGQFCTAHFSWLCQAGQGRCQSATAATP